MHICRKLCVPFSTVIQFHLSQTFFHPDFFRTGPINTLSNPTQMSSIIINVVKWFGQFWIGQDIKMSVQKKWEFKDWLLSRWKILKKISLIYLFFRFIIYFFGFFPELFPFFRNFPFFFEFFSNFFFGIFFWYFSNNFRCINRLILCMMEIMNT